MALRPETAPGIGPYRRLLLDMAQERSVEALLHLIVDRLAQLPDAALARIWLLERGDICPTCPMAAECPDQTACLHLVASAGRSLEDGRDWSGLGGRFRRFPIGVYKVGLIASRAEAIEVPDLQEDGRWLADPGWACRERIRGFAGQPLLHRGQVLGVLGVFLRARLDGDLLVWLRMIADHAAAAIANARAFEEIERLRSRVELENDYLRAEVKAASSFGEIVGASPALRAVLEQVDLVGPTDAGVLILGESGTGKELVARALHERSRRREGPMIKVNCASVPRDLFESEFFGHTRGSFTGAVRDRVGRFELAGGGTLFLDEVGEIPLDMQGKLLRVIQERTFERVGEERSRTVDVRIIAATNQNLKAEVEAGRFRQDLYYRLSVFPIVVPPLRERLDDVPVLAAHFMRSSCWRLGIPERPLAPTQLAELQSYAWPGNIRELQNVIERAAIASRTGLLRLELPASANSRAPKNPGASTPHSNPDGVSRLLSYAEVESLERENLLAALRLAHWKVSGKGGAADLLGVKATTLSSRIKAMGIQRPG
ncbi:sigma-54-dependent Fis family transcriptional regulator [Singulisphaera acidiphila]|uniref:Transcriptional regulator containing GAF, AAA-type ATPase, and DNA binding domains n=1 Tax=Singulisphaera acidiphila (strain ATCC BAA-1392 / DSM 18658 / VKM B-2454 / MOB10) TaxID=886293 RepID=L0D8B5_SINAD|nr:sigma 54-interacting transcriptional regulator [Singulisphaera acidiphila]AGA25654.1 transcriptional regulator containing GAF, AAA-type ATPase, and DNA binding domains [Singulisphaera acidiphila DSM 18658]